jgi:hypothetical protein
LSAPVARGRSNLLLAVCALAGAFSLCGAQTSSSGRQISPLGGYHYGVPLKSSGDLALLLAGKGDDFGGPIIAGEFGAGGWRASAGYFRLTGNLGTGYAMRATYLRTNNRPWRASPRSSFVGAEAQYMPAFVIGARIGAFARVAGVSRRGLVTADVSWLF